MFFVFRLNILARAHRARNSKATLIPLLITRFRPRKQIDVTHTEENMNKKLASSSSSLVRLAATSLAAVSLLIAGVASASDGVKDVAPASSCANCHVGEVIPNVGLEQAAMPSFQHSAFIHATPAHSLRNPVRKVGLVVASSDGKDLSPSPASSCGNCHTGDVVSTVGAEHARDSVLLQEARQFIDQVTRNGVVAASGSSADLTPAASCGNCHTGDAVPHTDHELQALTLAL